MVIYFDVFLKLIMNSIPFCCPVLNLNKNPEDSNWGFNRVCFHSLLTHVTFSGYADF